MPVIRMPKQGFDVLPLNNNVRKRQDMTCCYYNPYLFLNLQRFHFAETGLRERRQQVRWGVFRKREKRFDRYRIQTY